MLAFVIQSSEPPMSLSELKCMRAGFVLFPKLEGDTAGKSPVAGPYGMEKAKRVKYTDMHRVLVTVLLTRVPGDAVLGHVLRLLTVADHWHAAELESSLISPASLLLWHDYYENLAEDFSMSKKHWGVLSRI
jgi:hypothetical protein